MKVPLTDTPGRSTTSVDRGREAEGGTTVERADRGFEWSTLGDAGAHVADPSAPLVGQGPAPRIHALDLRNATIPERASERGDLVVQGAASMLGQGRWHASAIVRDRDGNYHRKDGYQSFTEWFEGRDPLHGFPPQMSCSDLLMVASARSGALSLAQVGTIQDVALLAAAEGDQRSYNKEGPTALPPTYDTADQARAAFLYDALGYSRARDLTPEMTLKAGDVVFFGRTGDHVALATGNGREVLSIWETGRFKQVQCVERTTIDALAALAAKELQDPTPEMIATVPFKHRLVTDHLVARNNPDGTLRVRVSHPWSELPGGALPPPDDAQSWGATRKVLGEERTARVVAALRQRLAD